MVDKIVALKDLSQRCDRTIDRLGQKFKKAAEKCEISLLYRLQKIVKDMKRDSSSSLLN